LVIVGDQLTGAQVPPHIGIGHAACRHREQAESENDDKNSARFEH
jgi:hypothetical protein